MRVPAVPLILMDMLTGGCCRYVLVVFSVQYQMFVDTLVPIM